MADDSVKIEGKKESGDGTLYLIAIGFLVVIVTVFLAGVFAIMGYFRGSMSGSGWITGQGTAGGLCETVPEPYKSVFAEAGGKFNVQPAFVAAIFYGGEHGNSWPTFEEHAALGTSLNPRPHNCGSSVGCIRGPMQIGEKNWPSWSKGAYGSSTPTERIEWTRDSIEVAAYHLAITGAGGNTTDEAKLQDAASIYNSGRPWSIGQGIPETAKYVPRVMAAYQSFLCVNAGGAGTGDWMWPADGRASDNFGQNRGDHTHNGIDISAPRGTPVKASRAGRVTRARQNGYNNGNGTDVAIDHGDGFESIYLHMVEGSLTVRAGDVVNQGQVIGQVDNTGHSFGNHLHFSIKYNDKYVNPMDYLPPK